MLQQMTLLNLTKRLLHTSTICHGKFTSTTETDGVREIKLNDPKRRNALSMEMMEELHADVTRCWDDKSLRCIVISSTGPVFSSGHNLKELVPETGIEYHQKVFNKCSEIMLALLKAPVPVIAKVDGHAAAAGCQLVASCDMIICSDRSKFSTPGGNVGIFCSTPGIPVARTTPRMKSAYMLFTGFPITAEEAYISGLVSVTVPPEKLDEEVEKVCSAIKGKSRAVIELGKKFFYKQISMGIEKAYEEGGKVMVDNISLPDGQEGIRSFVEKRHPKWKH